MPDATGHGQSRPLSFTPDGAGCGYARYPRGRSVPPSKIQAATHQASLKRKIKNDSAHCWWASTILYGECRIEELKTAGPCDRPPHEGVLPWR